MFRRTSMVLSLVTVMGCSDGAVNSVAEVTPEQLAGDWRSITPSLEFVRLTVVSKSSEQGVMAIRLTLSGREWQGQGSITRDFVVLTMTPVGSPSVVRTAILSHDAGKLFLKERSSAQAPALDLTFVRAR